KTTAGSDHAPAASATGRSASALRNGTLFECHELIMPQQRTRNMVTQEDFSKLGQRNCGLVARTQARGRASKKIDPLRRWGQRRRVDLGRSCLLRACRARCLRQPMLGEVGAYLEGMNTNVMGTHPTCETRNERDAQT